MKFNYLLLRLVVVLCMFFGCVHTATIPYKYINKELNETAVRVIPIYIDKDFGEGDLVVIEDAINQWNFALNGYVKLQIKSVEFDMDMPTINLAMRNGGWLILRINQDNYMVHDENSLSRTLAFTDQIGGHLLYIVRDRINNDMVFGIMLHEIGHLMGARHDQTGGLMYPNYNTEGYRCIDERTILQVAEHEFIPADRLNYCVFGELE